MNLKLILCFAASLLILACGENKESESKLSPAIVDNPVTANSVDSEKRVGPKMEFTENRHHFGEIKEGEVVNYSFKFKNVGDADVLISAADGSCGCTVPSFSKEPIKPGKTGSIDVSFDSKGRHGMQSKTVTVIANTIPNSKVLTISAEVISAK
ncbi:MAG: DUF1573 domain-containing protein [Bacteroidia bacterium]|nr:DUF1573 domain-containing protein [Bacteroidia bacterium]